MPEIANLVVRYSADTADAEAGANRVNSTIGKMGKTAAMVGAAAGVAIGGFLVNGINAAANFEQGMSGVAASLGGVGTAGGITEAQFKSLSDEALRIGQTTSVGATDAARAMDLLAKAGVSTESIINGTAQAVVNVSEATGESIDQSASSLGSLSNLFASTGISGSEMADVIVNAMNSSDATLSEFQTGIANLAPVISGTGMEFDEAAGLISYFNAQGMAAAKVGSSLNSAYMNLVNPTTAQAEAQAALGVAVYDSAGQFRGFPAILDDVRTATEGMTDQQRDAWITQLFGAEALDVVTMALEGQKGALEDHIGAMDESGAAATAAATRMDNLKGDIEGLKGAFETLSIKVGQAFTPALRTATQALTGMLTGGMKFVEELKLMYDTGNVFTEGWIKTFPGWAQPVVRAIVGIHEAFEDVIDAFQDLRRGDVGGFFRELQEAASGAWDTLKQFGATVWDALVDALSNVDWGAVWSAFTSGLSTLASAGLDLGTMIVNGALQLGSAILDGAGDLWGWFKKQIGVTSGGSDPMNPFGGGTEPITLGDVMVNAALRLADGILGGAASLWDWVKSKLGVGGGVGGINVPNPFGGTSGNKIDLGDVLLDAKFQVTQLLANAKTAIEGVVNDIKGFVDGHKEDIKSAVTKLFDFDIGGDFGNNLGTRLGQWLDGLDWSGLFGKGLDLQTKLMQGIAAIAIGAATLLAGSTGQMSAAIFGFLTGVIGAINWGGIKNTIGDKFREAFSGASDKVQEAIQKISDYLGRELMNAANGVDAAIAPAKTAIEGLRTAFNNGRQAVTDFATNAVELLGIMGSGIDAVIEPIVSAINKIGDAAKAALGFLEDLMFWQDQNSGRPDGQSGTPRQNQTTGEGMPGSGYVTPNNTGEAVNLPGGGYITNLPNVGAGPAAGLANAATQAAAAVEAAMKAIAGSMSAGATAVQTGASSMTTTLTNLGVAFATAQTFITTALTAIGTAVSTGFTTMQTTMTTAMTNMGTAVATGFTFISTTFTTALTSIGTTVTTAMTTMQTTVTTGMTNMGTAVATGMTSIVTNATNAMTSFADAVSDGFQSAVDSAQSGVQGILGAVLSIGSLYGVGSGIGSSLGEGIVDGLNSMIGAVSAAAANLASAAAGGAQARGEISSPSRLMAREVGVPLAQGVIAGMNAERGNVYSAFANMIPVDARLGRGFTPSGAGRGANHAPVQNITIVTLEPGKWQEYLRKAERGDVAFQQIGGRARETALGPSRRV